MIILVPVITKEFIKTILPGRNLDCHKGDFGKLGLLCGSINYPGAALLSCMGAIRSGVGITELFCPESIYGVLAGKLPEVIMFDFDTNKTNIKYFNRTHAVKIIQNVDGFNAFVIGCGIGFNPSTRDFIFTLLTGLNLPIILDADGINCAAPHINVLPERTGKLILTPHPGELARLLRCEVSAVQADRCGAAITAAKKIRAVIVLKGFETVIASPNGQIMINKTGCPGMAKGGSGDVLAGIIGGFVAQGIEPFEASAAGVYIHGIAGEITQELLGQYSMLPSELAANLPLAFKSLND